MSNHQNFSGAGVLILERDIHDNIFLILVRDLTKQCWTEPGGRFDHKHRSISQTAKDELYEETLALFKAKSVNSLNNNNYFDRKYRKKIYRTFVVWTDTLQSLKKDYYNNFIHIFTNPHLFGGDPCYRETDNITRIKLDDIYSTLSKNNKVKNVYIKDVYNKRILLHKRTVQILRTFLFGETLDIKIKYIKPKITRKNKLVHYIF